MTKGDATRCLNVGCNAWFAKFYATSLVGLTECCDDQTITAAVLSSQLSRCQELYAQINDHKALHLYTALINFCLWSSLFLICFTVVQRTNLTADKIFRVIVLLFGLGSTYFAVVVFKQRDLSFLQLKCKIYKVYFRFNMKIFFKYGGTNKYNCKHRYVLFCTSKNSRCSMHMSFGTFV